MSVNDTPKLKMNREALERRAAHNRSNLGIWRTAVNSCRSWLERVGIRTPRVKSANAIPAHLRPWMPKNLQLNESDTYALIFELKRVCTKSQYKHLVKRYDLERKAGLSVW